MYQVEVKNVNANTKTSFFPESSNLSGECLEIEYQYCKSIRQILISHIPDSVTKEINNIFNNIFRKNSERHWHVFGKRKAVMNYNLA
jgi:hypothetical protein